MRLVSLWVFVLLMLWPVLGLQLDLGQALEAAEESNPKAPVGSTGQSVVSLPDSLLVQPSLLWTRRFDEIEGVTMSIDGSRVLVTTGLDVGGEHVNKRHIVSRQGEEIGTSMGKGGVLSGDGKRVIGVAAVEDLQGKTLELLEGSPIESGEEEWVIYSPARDYFAVEPSYEADHAFLRVYDARTGELLWKMDGPEHTFLTASFCSEETLAAYTEGKVSLYDVRTGKKYWEKFLWLVGESASYPAQLATSPSGQIAALLHKSAYLPSESYSKRESRIYSLSRGGDVRWEYKCSKWGWLAISPDGRYVAAHFGETLFLFDNDTGHVLWQRGFDFMYPPQGAAFSADDKVLFIAGYLSGDERRYKTQANGAGKELTWTKSTLYAFDVQGNVVWRRPVEAVVGDVDLEVLVGGNYLLVRDMDDLHMFDVSKLTARAVGGRSHEK
ncbi:MAG: PQQ-binding-like beta-propeller repeat protein [Candidatus Eisenbacteria bacterium]|nr:PQQ-binding-like beta-propeller repeat protein [Candidatus Eisenbacteria bacterium]